MNLNDLSPEEEMTLRLCALYEQTTSIEEFCDALQLDPFDPSAIELYESVHRSYTDIWSFLGNDAFEEAMDARKHMRLQARTLLNGPT